MDIIIVMAKKKKEFDKRIWQKRREHQLDSGSTIDDFSPTHFQPRSLVSTNQPIIKGVQSGTITQQTKIEVKPETVHSLFTLLCGGDKLQFY
jgi:hypothetical protein